MVREVDHHGRQSNDCATSQKRPPRRLERMTATQATLITKKVATIGRML